LASAITAVRVYRNNRKSWSEWQALKVDKS
jgi:hypothetical protein